MIWNLYYDIDSKKELIDSSYPPIIGWGVDVEEKISTLYVEKGKLYFSCDNLNLEIIDEHFVRLNTIKQINKFLVKKRIFLIKEKTTIKR